MKNKNDFFSEDLDLTQFYIRGCSQTTFTGRGGLVVKNVKLKVGNTDKKENICLVPTFTYLHSNFWP